MIIDKSQLDDAVGDFRADIKLLEGEQEIRAFNFVGSADHIFERILEVEAFALSYMADHKCSLTAKTKLESLADK